MFGRMSRGLFVAVLALAFTGWAAAQQPQPQKPEAKPQVKPEMKTPQEKEGKNLLETAREAKLMTFVELVKMAGLEKELEGPMHLTVFAATDEAFKEYPGLADLKKPENKMKLADFLKGHMVAKKVDLKTDKMARSLEGAEIMIGEKAGKTILNDKVEVTKDLPASNGTLYVINGVIAPAAKPEIKGEHHPIPAPKPEGEKPAPKPGERTH
jgi:uncharacterized surface protein with fasciclin (FAS1) repeats